MRSNDKYSAVHFANLRWHKYVEVELLHSQRPGKIRDEIERVIDNKALVTGCSDTTSKAWKVSTDNSMKSHPSQYGVEIVSPILRGEGVNFKDLKRLCQNWLKYEKAIDLLLPIGRRDSKNGYCLSVRDNMRFGKLNNRQAHDLIAQQTSIKGLAKVMNVHAESRNCYFKLFLQNLVNDINPHNTIEFRGHGGTCDAAEIESWVRLVVQIIGCIRCQHIGCSIFRQSSSKRQAEKSF
eukprot:scaffold6439_cov167-Amphora_coffeaeformis.AAC.17